MEDYPKEAYCEGDYILNHYDRNSHADKIILARNLHRWAIKYSAQQGLHLTAFRRGVAVALVVSMVVQILFVLLFGGR
jgi:hypothetical protein